MQEEILAAHARGWWLTPVNKKVPILNAWASLPRQSDSDISKWDTVGVRTGHGFVVVDVDPGAPPEWSDLAALPVTPISRTPRGGLHIYLAGDLPNSAGKLAPHVDVRGKGGQAVLYGRWLPERGPDTPIAPVPTAWIAALSAGKRERYALAALRKEIERVRLAPEGTRNDALNRAAFSLGQLVTKGDLQEADVRAELESAALSIGLEPNEIASTLDSGLKGGAIKPRVATPTHYPTAAPSMLLVPGSHATSDGCHHEVSTARFTDSVLAALKPGTLYRRDRIVGVIDGDRFRAISTSAMRVLIDSSVALYLCKQNREKEYVRIFVPTNDDYARILLAAAETHKNVRELQAISTCPVFLPEWRMCAPGWNESAGLWCAYSGKVERQADPIAVLTELVCDFPFKTHTDRLNFWALLLTPIIRPAITGNVPLFLIGSPVERSGKTKLAEDVLGITICGKPTPAMQFSGTDEERDKRILAMLMLGVQALHLDNLSEYLDSPALASLVTSSAYTGRVLGRSELVSMPVRTILVGSGNNLRSSGEIAKRTVPINLEPVTDSPETREGFVHDPIQDYLVEARPRVLGALVALVEAWIASGAKRGALRFGGFEGWARAVSAILPGDLLANRRAHVDASDQDGADLRTLVEKWWAKYQAERVTVAEIHAIVIGEGLYPRVQAKPSEAGQRIAVGLILRRVVGRIVGGYQVNRYGTNSAAWYHLTTLPDHQ